MNDSEMEDVGRVPSLPRSALACWWSITHLIRETEAQGSHCYLWTITCGQVVPDHWFGQMHSVMVRNVGDAARRGTQSSAGGTIPQNWGGVRVFEAHPGGHGLHAHWVMRHRMDWHVVKDCALRAGLGPRIHVDFKPCRLATAYYLAMYLLKGDKLRGLRAWANIGTYDGIGGRDIELDSARIRAIRQWRARYVAEGKGGYMAYLLACEQVDAGRTCPGCEPF